jgi:hypothetical protein
MRRVWMMMRMRMSGRMRRWCRVVDEVMMRRVERLDCVQLD